MKLKVVYLKRVREFLSRICVEPCSLPKVQMKIFGQLILAYYSLVKNQSVFSKEHGLNWFGIKIIQGEISQKHFLKGQFKNTLETHCLLLKVI